MPYQSNLPAVLAKIRAATDAGLRAAAEVGVNETKNTLIPEYFAGGKYKTGHLAASIHAGEPEGPDGGRFIRYGTNVMYALFWEVGFMKWPSYFSKKLNRWVSFNGENKVFRRKEIWMPIFLALKNGGRFQSVFQKVFDAHMKGGSGFGTQRAASPRSPDSA